MRFGSWPTNAERPGVVTVSPPVLGEDELSTNGSALELLALRKQSRSLPGERKDGRRLALVVEGGGMRGVITAGMLWSLERLGYRHGFDAVYGVSAGAIAGAYFIAGQAISSISIYLDIANRRFINLWRMALALPAVSMEYLLDDVCRFRWPLDFENFRGANIDLRIIAASLGHRRPETLTGFADRSELFEALRASSRIPFFAGPPVPFRGDAFLDASLYVSIPYEAAIEDEATDIIVLLSRPEGYLRRKPSWINRRLVLPHLRRLNPEFAALYTGRASRYRTEIETIQKHEKGKLRPEIFVIRPPQGATDVTAFETSRRKIMAAGRAGANAAYAALGHDRAKILPFDSE